MWQGSWIGQLWKVKRRTSQTTSDYKRLQLTTSDYEWLQATTSQATNDYNFD